MTVVLGFLRQQGIKLIGGAIIVAIIGGGIYLYHRNGYNLGYKAGYAQSLKDNPPNVYTGTTTVNQQPCPSPTVVGLSVGKFGFGFIMKR